MPKPVLLVHGGMTGPWEWERVVPILERSGISVSTVDLPSRALDGTLLADETAVRQALRAFDEPAVLVGHSYSGMVITGASTLNDDVAHLVYVCAALPQEGQALADAVARQEDDTVVPAPVLEGGGGDLAGFRRDVCNDTDDEQWESVRPQIGVLAAEVYTAVPSGLGWREHPVAYVVCTLDRTFPPGLQRRMASHAGQTAEIEAAHIPMITQPEKLAAIIAGVAIG
ncbi:MAG: hypothetical protein JWR01_291 [Subtercola sp.]|nr:hypothetical protein [Subtercola sp.]